MKRCPRCEKKKSAAAFGKNRTKKNGLSSYCLDCMKLYRMEHYRSNPAPYKKRAAASKKKRLAYLRDIREEGSCARCGFEHPAALEFHHKVPVNRDRAGRAGVGWFATFGMSRMLEELAKCELICANCHRIEHHGHRYMRRGLG